VTVADDDDAAETESECSSDLDEFEPLVQVVEKMTAKIAPNSQSTKPTIYRNGTSCTAMKQVNGEWMQCCKLELHKGQCDFTLGADWEAYTKPKPKVDAAADTAEGGDAAAPPKVTGIVHEPPKRPKRLVFGVHDVYGKKLPAERLDKVGAQQLGLFG
jgi:hypothetical protein